MNKVMNILGIISRVLIIILLLTTTLLSIGTAYIMFAPDSLPKPFRLMYDLNSIAPTPEVVLTPEPTKMVEVAPGQGIIVTTGAKIINLSGTTGSKYIRVTISLEFNPNDPKFSEMKGEIKNAYLTQFSTDINNKLPILDHEIITIIATKTYDNLYTAAGKESLRKELLAGINGQVLDYKVIAIYFTEFVIN